MKILIFSGTTEGRKLSEMLAASGISHTVSVASQYGCDVMTENPLVSVRIGRMDESEMNDFLSRNGFGDGDIIVDATHPYAADVSRNIFNCANAVGSKLFFVKRCRQDSDGSPLYDGVIFHDSMEDFAGYIDDVSGNILLTTGTNTLASYCRNVSSEVLAATYVRVLPAKESIGICHECGIETSHIIAMQGPFSYEMNRAVLAQFSIKHMLTKDSGAAGGFAEKINAALDLGVTVHALSRPKIAVNADDGDDVFTVYEKITGHPYVPKRRIVLAGIGPGSKRCMTAEVIESVKTSDAVFGAASVTANINALRKFDMYLAKDIIDVLETNKELVNISVLFSGDSSFYSGAKEAYTVFRKWDENADITILPGVSSVSYLAAKLAESYDDAVVISIHGRNSLHNINNLVSMIRQNTKVYALLSGDEDLRTVAKKLKGSGTSTTVYIGQNLSYDPSGTDEGENIVSMTVEEAVNFRREGKITVLFKA